MRSNSNILWLPAWYPGKENFLNGDFTDRHARATSKKVNISVLFVSKDATLGFNRMYTEKEQSDGLTIYRGYYNTTDNLGLFSKIRSVQLYLTLLFRLYKIAKNEQGSFQLVHVHISLRQGLLAQWLKWKHQIPYVITEQNSWFMPVGDQYYTHSLILRKIIRSNFKNANAVHVVSASLGRALQEKFKFIKHFTVMPNVVDTTIFFPVKSQSEASTNTFFCITSDVYHKNTDGILRAFSIYLKNGNTGILRIAGPNYEDLVLLAMQLSMKDHVKFLGAVTYKEVAQNMQAADALIFFTRYETFGCVLAEALCCGTPVIASRIPVLQENLQEHENALFVEPENEEDLAEKMAAFSSQKHLFLQESIARQAHDEYQYSKVGEDLFKFYKTVLAEL